MAHSAGIHFSGALYHVISQAIKDSRFSKTTRTTASSSCCSAKLERDTSSLCSPS